MSNSSSIYEGEDECLMKKNNKLFSIVLSLIIVIISMSGCAQGNEAQYPEKPIDMIIIWGAGGGSDLAARLIGDYASKELGQPFTYNNVTGANGAIGWGQAVQAQADGYTVANLTFDVLTNQAMGQTPTKFSDFDLLMQFSRQPVGVFVPGDSPYNTVDELLKAAQENPEKIQMATTALGGFFHQAAGLLESKVEGAKFKYVPYKGSAQIISALAGKHVSAGIQTLTGMEQHLKEGNMRLLAVLSEERHAGFPDIPTAKELGYDVVWESWRGFAVPKGTPEDVKEKLVDAFKIAFENPEFQEKAVKAKLNLIYRGPDDFKSLLETQYPQVESVLKQLDFIK